MEKFVLRYFNLIRTIIAILIGLVISVFLIYLVSKDPGFSLKQFLLGPFLSRGRFSNMIETIFEGEFSEGEAGLFPPPIRFCVNSISTLLMYRRLEVLYQFLHVLTAKLKKIEGVGIYLLNSESFDDKTLSMIKQLMNCVIEVKIENNTSYLRIQGIRGVSGEWLKFSVAKGQVSILP